MWRRASSARSALERLVAVELGHQQVEQHDVDRRLGHDLQRLQTVLGLDRLDAQLGQRAPEQHPVEAVVVDDERAAGHGRITTCPLVTSHAHGRRFGRRRPARRGAPTRAPLPGRPRGSVDAPPRAGCENRSNGPVPVARPSSAYRRGQLAAGGGDRRAAPRSRSGSRRSSITVRRRKAPSRQAPAIAPPSRRPRPAPPPCATGSSQITSPCSEHGDEEHPGDDPPPPPGGRGATTRSAAPAPRGGGSPRSAPSASRRRAAGR